MSFAVKCATADTGQFQLASLFIMQIEVRLNAAKRAGDMVHNLIDQNVKIEDGRNLRDPLLQFEQIVNLPALQRAIDHRSYLSRIGNRSHTRSPTALLRKKMPLSTARILFYLPALAAAGSALSARGNVS